MCTSLDSAPALRSRGRGDAMPGDRCCRRPGRRRRDPRARAGAGRGRRRPRRVAAYASVCGFTLRDELPPTYPHVLAFPLHMALLATAPRSAPSASSTSPTGSSSTARSRSASQLTIRRARDAAAAAPAGQTFDFVTEARVGDELVWEGVARTSSAATGRVAARAACARSAEEPPVTAEWRLADDLGRRYARRLRRPQPDPPARADREGVRLPARDRARDVDEGALPGLAGACRTPSPSTSRSRSRSCCRRRSSSRADATAGSPSPCARQDGTPRTYDGRIK